jgi:hypothetical protein
MNICAPDRDDKQDNEPEEVTDAFLYRHLIVNHVGLRDHYASAALIGILARDGIDTITGRCELAFSYADAMIAARNRK